MSTQTSTPALDTLIEFAVEMARSEPDAPLIEAIVAAFGMAVDYVMVQPEGMRAWWQAVQRERPLDPEQVQAMYDSAEEFLRVFAEAHQ